MRPSWRKVIFHLGFPSTEDRFWVKNGSFSTSFLSSRTLFGIDTCNPCGYCHSEFICTQCLEDLIPQCPQSHLDFKLFQHHRQWSLNLDGRYFIRHTFKAESSKNSHILYILWLWVSIFIPICYMKLLWKWLSNAWNCEYSRMPLKVLS